MARRVHGPEGGGELQVAELFVQALCLGEGDQPVLAAMGRVEGRSMGRYDGVHRARAVGQGQERWPGRRVVPGVLADVGQGVAVDPGSQQH